MATVNPAAVHIDPARIIDEVDPRIYSGFTEHMGRCIYGGIYDPDNQHGLADPKTGFRKDVIDALKSLKVPVIRYPGGNFVSSYRWQDGIGPKELRPRRPELAWRAEESNQFGTDEFMQFCREVGAEPYICLNMGTGTLEDALGWLEYCNGTGTTYYASLRRKNGNHEPYRVKYWSLGNEVWGPWQVGQMEAEQYAKTAFQWAKAMRMLDPSIEIVSCGETGRASWDWVTLKTLAPVVDYHSIHEYTRSEGNHAVNVMGPSGAEMGINITRSLIDLAKIENKLSKKLTICFDEWNVWDPVRAPGEQGAEESYDLSDAIAVASWLNVFVRNADIVKMACIAQSVNVISPIMTSPTGLYRQTTYWALYLYAKYMRGAALNAHVLSPSYAGPTVPPFIHDLTIHTPDQLKLTKFVDVSAVIDSAPDNKDREIRVAIVNRHATDAFDVDIKFGPKGGVSEKVTVVELWSPSLADKNGFDEERVKPVVKEQEATGVYRIKEHSVQVLIFTLEK